MEFRKMVMITLYARQQKRHRCIEQSLDSVGEGEGGMIWENGIETCIISYTKWISSPGSMQDTGCLGLVHWDDPERWYGEGGGRGVQDGEHVYTRGGFMLSLLMNSSCWSFTHKMYRLSASAMLFLRGQTQAQRDDMNRWAPPGG